MWKFNADYMRNKYIRASLISYYFTITLFNLWLDKAKILSFKYLKLYIWKTFSFIFLLNL